MFAKYSKISTVHHGYTMGSTHRRSPPFEIIPSHFPLLISWESKRANNWSAESEHIFNIAGDTRGACVHLSMRYTESLRFREAGERGPKACLSYWRLSALASGARNTCSDFAVNRRPGDYPRVFRYDRPSRPRTLRAILSPDPVVKKKKGKRKNRLPVRKIMAPREGIAALGKNGRRSSAKGGRRRILNKYSDRLDIATRIERHGQAVYTRDN